MLNKTMRTAIAALSLSALSIGCAIAEDNKEFTTIKIQSDEDITVALNENGVNQVFMFDMSELEDINAIDEKLINVPEDTRLRVMEALEKLKSSDIELKLQGLVPELEQKFIFLEKELNSGDFAEAFESLKDKEIELVKLINGSSADRITRSIEKGDFTPEQLDKIQAALDAKR